MSQEFFISLPEAISFPTAEDDIRTKDDVLFTQDFISSGRENINNPNLVIPRFSADDISSSFTNLLKELNVFCSGGIAILRNTIETFILTDYQKRVNEKKIT